MTAGDSAAPAVRLVRQRLRPRRRSARPRLGRLFDVAVVAALIAGLGAGAMPDIWHALSAPGVVAPGAPGRLFVAGAVLLLLAGALGALRAAGPVSASRALRFWVLSAPVSLRRMLGPRCLALMAAVVLAFGLVAAALAHLAATGVVISVASASVGAVLVTAASIWAQTSEPAAQAVHGAAHALAAAAMLAFGSLATGVARARVNAALGLPAIGVVVLLAVALAATGYCVARAIRGLDELTPAELGRGEGVWTSARLTATAMDTALVGEFLADRRARAAGRVRSRAVGRSFVRGALALEFVRLRRRPVLVARGLMLVVVWWGCRAVLAGPAMAVLAVLGGYLGVALPMAATVRELSRRPGLRAQFTRGQQHVLVGASTAACAAGVTAWLLAVCPGLAVAHLAFWALVPSVLVVAAYRASSRPDLDYTVAPISTPFGDIPVDLLRQLLRGHLLVAVTIVLLQLA